MPWLYDRSFSWPIISLLAGADYITERMSRRTSTQISTRRSRLPPARKRPDCRGCKIQMPWLYGRSFSWPIISLLAGAVYIAECMSRRTSTQISIRRSRLPPARRILPPLGELLEAMKPAE